MMLVFPMVDLFFELVWRHISNIYKNEDVGDVFVLIALIGNLIGVVF